MKIQVLVITLVIGLTQSQSLFQSQSMSQNESMTFRQPSNGQSENSVKEKKKIPCRSLLRNSDTAISKILIMTDNNLDPFKSEKDFDSRYCK